MKFTFSPEKMGNVEVVGRSKGHNGRTHPTESQLANKAAWFATADHHSIVKWDDAKITRAKGLAKRKDAVVAIDFVLQVGNQADWR